MIIHRKSNIAKYRKFHGCARFIDDLVCLNDGDEFNDCYKEIYPNELELIIYIFLIKSKTS